MTKTVTREEFEAIVAARCPLHVRQEPRIERDVEYSYECYDDEDGNEVAWIAYRTGEEPAYYVRSMTRTITTLSELLDALHGIDEAREHPERYGIDPYDDHAADMAEVEYCRSVGLPVRKGECDTTSLPTFGGNEPENTQGVWSWDETHMIVGTCPSDMEIVSRAAFKAFRPVEG